jgi:predicted nucleotidyltransferase component of viral defense system
MDLEEILAEKVRALMERKFARDFYDIWFLIKNDVKADVGLVNRKLQMHSKKLEFAEFQEVISQVKLAWERDLSPLLPMIPNFDTLGKEVIEKLFP